MGLGFRVITWNCFLDCKPQTLILEPSKLSMQMQEALALNAASFLETALLESIFGSHGTWAWGIGFRDDLGFPRIRGTVLGVSIIRIILFWDLYWGPLFRETAS